MKKISLSLIAILFTQTSVADSIAYTCEGDISYINGVVTCNDKRLDENGAKSNCESENRTVCGYEVMQRHANGGGLVSTCAAEGVSARATIDTNVTVCGSPKIGPNVIITGDSKISGNVEIEGTTLIVDSQLSGASKILTSVIQDSSLSGASDIKFVLLVSSSVSGASSIDSAEVKSSAVSGASKILYSIVESVTASGSSFISDSSVKNRAVSGNTEIIGSK